MRGLSISKNSTNILKTCAILMVIVSHYYRYYAIDSPLSALSAMGFFGAALFAFLSGYGVASSHLANGFGARKIWITKKIVRVYIPFLIINVLSVLFVYGIKSEDSIAARIIMGTDDFVMWYVPFILAFYLIFLLIYQTGKRKLTKMLLLIGAGMAQCVVFEVFELGSQWYTSTGALIAGVAAAEFGSFAKDGGAKKIYLAASVSMLCCGAVFSRVFSKCNITKDWFTIVSGIGFCLFVFIFFSEIDEKLNDIRIGRMMGYFGNASLWAYLLHMKVLAVLTKLEITSLILFLVVTVILSVIFMECWQHHQRGRWY